jgi:hypothetical protein
LATNYNQNLLISNFFSSKYGDFWPFFQKRKKPLHDLQPPPLNFIFFGFLRGENSPQKEHDF